MIVLHGVQTPLTQFCEMVRSGKIPSRELTRLIKKYSQTKEDFEQVFEKVLNSAREIARTTEDANISASLRVVIAGFSHKDEDIEIALKSVKEIKNGAKHQTLAVLVKTLAEANQLGKAWEIAPKIKDEYWMTMAILFIACVTDSPQDFSRAEIAAKHITGDTMRKEALADIEYAQAQKSNRSNLLKRASFQRERTEAVDELVRSLINLNNFDDAHEAALQMKSASLRIDVLESISRALSQIITPHTRK